jgi:hypothetical protein
MLDKLIGPVTGLLDKFIEDKDQKALLAHEVATMAKNHARELSREQLEVNKVEAAHKSLFVSGWAGSEIEVPLIPLDTMMPVLLGMLGLGGLRTFEKHSGVNRNK